MKNRGVKIVFLVLAAASLVSLLVFRYAQTVELAGLEEDSAAAPLKIKGAAAQFDLSDWDGGRANLADYRGKWLLINFWATWCPPCAEEMPSLSAFARRFAPKGLQVVAVSVDEGWEGVKAFFPHGKPAFRVLLDPGREIAVTYGTVKFPETYLVGPDGVLKAKFIGARDWSDARIIRYFEKLTGLE